MSKGKIIVLGVLGAIVFTGMIACSTVLGTYNSIQRQTQVINSAGSQITVQMQRRYDLIPNIVSTVEGYATLERTTFTAIAEARSKLGGAIQSGNLQQMAQANQTLGGVLGRLLMIQEQYPELKANQGFLELQAQLEGTENRISVARQDYNEAVRNYNTYISVFPNVVIANFMGKQPREFFEATTDSVKTAPKVKFN